MTRQELSDEYTRLHEQVCSVLWNEWDPIGVNKLGGPSDEYDSYAPNVANMLMSGSTGTEVASYLRKVEDTAMGLTITPQSDLHRQRTAEILVGLLNTSTNG